MIHFNGWKDFGKCLLISLIPSVLVGWAWVETGFWWTILTYCGVILAVILIHWFIVDVWERPPHTPWYTA